MNSDEMSATDNVNLTRIDDRLTLRSWSSPFAANKMFQVLITIVRRAALLSLLS
jgi:hypothetical protein